MPNKDEIDAVAKAATELIKATPVYQDAIQPVAQEMGQALKTLGGVINVALAPLAAVIYGYETISANLKIRLEARLANTLPENIVTPKLQVVGPLLERYKYVYDNGDLSEMFINLLANAMDKNQLQKAHPSFVNLISEISPDEAKLIKTIATEHILPKLDLKIKFPSDPEIEGDKEGYQYAHVNFTLLGEKAKLQYVDLTPSYLSNLERLNIISTPVGMSESYTYEGYYELLEDHEFVNKLREKVVADGNSLEIVRGIVRITDFGSLFMNAVLPSVTEPGP